MRDSLILGAVAAVLCCACTGSNPSSGQSAFLQIQGAQYVAGGIDTEPQSSLPEIHSISTANNQLFPGIAAKNISGTAGPGSNAVVMGLLGDTGHWVFPVQDLDQNRPGDFTFSCSASFSRNTPVGDGGAISLVVRSSDRNGNVGPAMIQPMTMDAPLPTGALVVSLDWDTEADLDLHVQVPSDADAGINEIWSRKPSGLPAGTSGATFNDATAAGYLDFDSNSQCVIDGRRVENVIFPSTVPSGEYTVRVDTFSLCGEVSARWRVQVFAEGWTEPSVAYGQSTETDTRFSHGQGAGVQALVFQKL
jgi:hypothetical protein